jgi:hypothetical protein
MLGMVNPPNDDGVGDVLVDALPQAATAATALMEMAPRMSGLTVMEILVVVRRRSLRAESPPMISRPRSHPALLPNREKDFTLVQSN